MPLLISFVNRFYAPRLSLAALDLETEETFWITRSDFEAVARETTGINGICRLGEHWVIGLQSVQTGIAVLDAQFRVVSAADISAVRNLHSICPTPDGLLIVSTGTEEIYAAE